MTRVVDASVALKWFVQEEDSERADAILDDAESLIAPDLIFAEVLNAAWRLCRMKVLPTSAFDDVVEHLDQYVDAVYPLQTLARRAADIAATLDHPVYDCFYLALAERSEAVVVSADRRLLAKVGGTPWQAMVQHLTDYEPLG